MSKRLRVINLGLPKSGTTTLGHALKVSGLKTADYRIRPHQTGDESLHRQFVGKLMYDGYFHVGDPLARMAAFDCFTEISVLRGETSLWPQMDWGLIDAIRHHHPGARFVSSWRDPRAISDSMLRWSNLGTERLPKGNIPGLPNGFGETTNERIRWIEAHYAHLERLFAGDDAYLCFDIARPDAAAQIGAHLGLTLKWWGRRNANKPRKQKKTESA
ncbi:sulfotransferase family protein [Lutimaribacter sp. EGI FJ00015]|uniref:Sulfotransferase family protein n=1 Tax=Lutimaribacter degradans TaxID=2945989 RepID=A0ACC5ZRL8_9RHOB|nr:sulfotransferase family protein [Lutimaribacter sp. EGI FJ00013]MCM2560962.1 sulfotransferase family protein [Lutimaribacter sp. EGI FJ00013]MCO0612092.1 sulfotransferase family protein [Lutimaribacter sp. EGI FJ00015]MCO0634788.1 sulfotransferase family protein [Lutimaribacter sp. EGI FJ00014]